MERVQAELRAVQEERKRKVEEGTDLVFFFHFWNGYTIFDG